MKRALVLSLLLTTACGGSKADGDVAAGPQGGSSADAGSSNPLAARWGGAPMELEAARTIVAEIEADWPRDASATTPASVDDVLRVLKLDQVNLFGDAVTFISTKTDVASLALHGQIELAWAEAYVMLADIMKTLHGKYDEELKALQAKDLTDEGTKRVADLQAAMVELDRVGPAFSRMAAEHLEQGAMKAQAAKDAEPTSYLGYRVAGDYYRLAGNWDAFKKEVEAVRANNPDSNGLRFLEGAAAFTVGGDANAATEYYRQALERDPQFVRAQAHLLTIQTEPKAMHDELVRLEQLNPDHQIISWAGWGITQAYNAWKAQQPDEG